MEPSNTFSQLIALYRDLGCPALKESKFSVDTICSLALIELLRSLWSSGGFDIELATEDNFFSLENDDSFPDLKENTALSIIITVYQNENGFIYNNVSDWIASAGSLKKGSISQNIYLAEEDLIVTEKTDNNNVAQVLMVCMLINKLSEIAHYHDEKNGNGSAYRLVFVIPDKDNKIYHPVILETQLSDEILQAQLPNISVLSRILEEQNSINNMHATERLSVFRIVLAEMIEKSPSNTETFTYLVKHWSDVTDAFNKSWESYLSGFSFSKLKAEIAEQQITFSQKLTDIVASLSGRMFSLPISIAAIILLEKANSPLANWFYLLSCALVTYMVASAVSIQRKNLENAESSCNMAFSELGKENIEKKISIQTELESAAGALAETTAIQSI